jgi:hypothetical protein
MKIATAGSKESLQKIINEYFYSHNYIITDDLKIFNTLKNSFLDGFEVIIKNNRWIFKESV